MASHYKVYSNSSDSYEFCFMPSLNISVLGIINQTLKYPQAEPFPKAGGIAFQFAIALFEITTNGLIGFELLKNKKLRGETITPSILSLVGANMLFLSVGLAYSFCSDTQLRCQILGMSGYGLMLCTAFNLFGIAIRKLYFATRINEKMFRGSSVLVAVSSWLVTFIVLLPTAIGRWGQVAVECNSWSCTLINVNEDGSNTGYSIAKIYYISYIIIGISNIVLNLATYCKIQSYGNAISSEIGKLNSNTQADLMKRERNLAIMMGTDSTLYVVFLIPRAILFFIDPYPMITAHGVARSFYSLWASTAIVEPILVLIFQEKYRKEIKKMFHPTSL